MQWFHRFVHHLERVNSKVEEALADQAPMKALAEMGYDPRRGLEFFRGYFDSQRQVDSRGDIKGDWILDEHPLDHHRVKLLTQHLGKLTFEYGSFAHLSSRPLPEILRKAKNYARHLLHTSYVDTLIPPKLFANWTLEKRLQNLERVFQLASQQLNSVRIKDFQTLVVKLVDSIKTAKDSETEKARLFEFINQKVVPKLESEDSLFINVFFNTVKNSGLYGSKRFSTVLYGKSVAGLAPLLQAFIDSESAIEAVKTAQKIQQHLVDHPVSKVFAKMVYRSDLLDNFYFPDLEDMEAIVEESREYTDLKIENFDLEVVSWNSHVNWALNEEANEILKTLILLGVADPRLNEHHDFEQSLAETMRLSKGPESSEYSVSDLVINEAGQVVDILDYRGESTFGEPPKFEDDLHEDSSDLEKLQMKVEKFHLEAGRLLRSFNTGDLSLEEFQLKNSSYVDYLSGTRYWQSMEINPHEDELLSNRNLFLIDPYAYTIAYENVFRKFLLHTDYSDSQALLVGFETELADLFQEALAKPENHGVKQFLRDFFLRQDPETYKGARGRILFGIWETWL